jgi:nitroreductase
MSLSARDVNEIKHAPAMEGVLAAIQERWSPRSFLEREVSRVTLAKVFEAARWAPSSSNEQPWRFVVGVRGAKGAGAGAYEKIFSSLVSFNQDWAGAAPVLILGVARTVFVRTGAPNAYALYDLGAAAFSVALEATALGLATHQMGGFDHEAARKALGIPKEYALGSVMALGYQGEPEAIANEKLREREIALRERKPLSEMVFSAWDEAMKLG